MKRLACISAIFITVLSVFCSAFASSAPAERYYESYEIKYGDTLWSISEEYKPQNMGTKEYMEELMEFNCLSGARIRAGRRLILPIYKL